MSAEEKDGKAARPPDLRPRPAAVSADESGSTEVLMDDLELEELSGSLLVDEEDEPAEEGEPAEPAARPDAVTARSSGAPDAAPTIARAANLASAVAEQLPTVPLRPFPFAGPAPVLDDDRPTLARGAFPLGESSDARSVAGAVAGAGAAAGAGAVGAGPQRDPAGSGAAPKTVVPARKTWWPLVAVGAAGLSAGVALVAGIIGVHRHHEARPVSPGASSFPAASAPAAATTASPSAAPSPSSESSATPQPSRACVLTGPPRVIAPKAAVAPGVEARAFGDDVAIAYAPGEHHAAVLRVDAATLDVRGKAVAFSRRPVRHATPVPSAGGHLAVAIDADRKGDALRPRRTLALDPPVQVGATAGEIAWAEPGKPPSGTLWPVPGDGPIAAVRGVQSDTDLSSVAVAFRHAGAVWVGFAAMHDRNLTASGDLRRLEPLGPEIGTPALAYSDGTVFLAWATRSTPADPWRLQWATLRADKPPVGPKTFAVPGETHRDANQGAQAVPPVQMMSPGVSALPGGGFLLLWTEGETSAHRVRAIGLSAAGEPLGDALTVSSPGMNAGEARAAIGTAGRGVVVFLESRGGGAAFELAGAPISCGP